MPYLFISDSIYVTFQEKTLSFEKVKIASSISLDAIKYKLAQKVRCSSFDGTNECSDLISQLYATLSGTGELQHCMQQLNCLNTTD